MTRRFITMTFLQVGGFALLWITSGWMAAMAVFLILWGHNIEKHHRTP